MRLLPGMAAAVHHGSSSRTASMVVSMRRPHIAAVVVLATLTTLASFALVDWNPAESGVVLEQQSGAGTTMLEQAGLADVVAAKKAVASRVAERNRITAEVNKDRAALEHARKHRDAIKSQAETLSTKLDKESRSVSDLTAQSETYGDVIGERKLKAQEQQHVVERARRRATSLANKVRDHQSDLKDLQHEAKTMSKRAASELKAAMKRGVSEASLKALAHKHLLQARSLKHQIQGHLHREIAALRSGIDKSKHAALRATEAAKHAGKLQARLLARLARHEKAAKLAQHKADNAALAVAEAEKEAQLDAGDVNAALIAAGKSKEEMVARLRASQTMPKKSSTLHTAKHPLKVLSSSDKPLGSSSAQAHSSRAEQDVKDEEAVADSRIKRLQAAKAAADKVVAREKEEADRIKRLLARNEQHTAKQPVTDTDRNREDDQEYNAAQSYLNRGDGVRAGPGAKRAIYAVEGDDAHVGVGGRNPELDAEASANNKEYQQMMHDEDVANNQDDDEYGRNDPMDTNIF